jgi:DNA-binding MurR/RpiR family transcriptional regulator
LRIEQDTIHASIELQGVGSSTMVTTYYTLKLTKFGKIIASTNEGGHISGPTISAEFIPAMFQQN